MSTIHRSWIISDDTLRETTDVLAYDDDVVRIDVSSIPNY